MVEGINMTSMNKQQLMAQVCVLAARAALAVQQHEPAEALTEAIVVLWPECPDLVELQAMALYLSQQYGEAMAVLHGRSDTRSLAIRGACLRRLQHPEWRAPLQEVLTRDDDGGALTFAYRMFDIAGEAVPVPMSVPEAAGERGLPGRFPLFQGVRA
jgi:hypothetical protein